MKNNFSPSSNTASLFSWFVRHWKQLLAAIVILSAIAFACHKLYLFYPYLNLPHVTAADLDALDLDGYDKVMFVAHPDDDLLWGGRHLIEDDYLVAKVEKLEAAVRELTEDEEDESSKFSVEELAIILDMDEEEIRDVLRLTGDDK